MTQKIFSLTLYAILFAFGFPAEAQQQSKIPKMDGSEFVRLRPTPA